MFKKYMNNIIFKEIIYAIKIYILWILIHNFSIQLYNKYCIPTNFISILLTPLITTNPFCKGLFYIFTKSTNMMDQMLIGFTMWFIPKFTMFTLKNINNNDNIVNVNNNNDNNVNVNNNNNDN